MDDSSDYLLEKARRYRQMAGQVFDQQAREALINLAEEFEACARAQRDRGEQQMG